MPLSEPRGTATAAAAALLLAACAGDAPRVETAGSDVASSAVPAAQFPRSLALPDTMLFRLASGSEVWWTIARESADSTGATCVERGLEVRGDGARVAVPLLYSADVPEIVDDTTIQVPLWTGCVPGRLYRVDTRTGQPTPAPLPEAGE